MTAVNNKKGLTVAALALSMFMVASCNDIKAKPTFYDDKIIESDSELTHNAMSIIYDALTDGSSNSAKVLDRVLDLLAKDYFGEWTELKAVTSLDEAKAVMQKHAKFYNEESDELNYAKLQMFVKDMSKRITESYYSEITNGSYAYRNRFNEEKYANYLKSQLYDVVEPTDGWYKNVLVTKEYKEDLAGALHVDAFEDYTNKYLIKKFYKEYLVEEYMYNENYSLLGRSYARQINYIALPTNTDYPGAAKNLLVAYAKKYIETPYTFSSSKVDFSVIEQAWNGLPTMSDEAKALLDDAGFTKATVTYELAGETAPVSEEYYPATKYGSMIEKFAKITSDRNTTKNQSDFTGSNSYPKEVGLQMEKDKIALASYTTDGWYIKTSSTSLPSDINTRLFNIGVANDVDHIGAGESSVDYQQGDYVAKKNGKYWLVPATSEKGDTYNYIIYDSASTTYYMVQVVEAVSTSKLSTSESNENNYAHLRADEGAFFTQTIAREVAKLYNSNDTYKNNAYFQYLDDANVIYHDEDVYEYFKDKYPELFE